MKNSLSELYILEELENTPSMKEKEQILKDNIDNKRLLFMLRTALDCNTRLYIKKFNVPDNTGKTALSRYDNFASLINKLTNGLRGNEAKEEVEDFFASCSPIQQKWYSRVIKKNLRIGVSVTLANKAGLNIPKFDVMLAKDGKKNKNLDKLVSNGGYVSRKLDGYRCLANIKNGNVTLFTRNGNIYSNFLKIEESLSKIFENESIVLDGEIMSDDFSSMQQTAFSTKNMKQIGDVIFYVFDAIDAREWASRDFKETKQTRLERLYSLRDRLDDNIKIVEHKYVSSVNEILELERAYIEDGFEGAMFVPDIPYYLGKKSNKMLKFKTMLSQDAEITGVYEGEDKYAGMFGGFILKQEDGQSVMCGSGFTDEDRKEIWSNKDKYIGRIIEVKYQELGSNGKMRFPVFMRFRDMGKNQGKM